TRAPHGIDVVQSVALHTPAPGASTAEQLQVVFDVLDDHEVAGTAAGTAARHRVQGPSTPAWVEQHLKRLNDPLGRAGGSGRLGPSRSERSNRRLGPSRSERSGSSVA